MRLYKKDSADALVSRSYDVGEEYKKEESYGFVFVDDNGNEIKSPKIESVSLTANGTNELIVTVNAHTSMEGASIEKYYYKGSGSGTFSAPYASTDSVYTFTGVKLTSSYTVSVEVKDTKGLLSSIYKVTYTP